MYVAATLAHGEGHGSWSVGEIVWTPGGFKGCAVRPMCADGVKSPQVMFPSAEISR
jgi:hypothetical protein